MRSAWRLSELFNAFQFHIYADLERLKRFPNIYSPTDQQSASVNTEIPSQTPCEIVTKKVFISSRFLRHKWKPRNVSLYLSLSSRYFFRHKCIAFNHI